MSHIDFFIEETSIDIPNPDDLIRWIESSISAEGFETKQINYIFCSDEYLRKINQEYLQHDYYTDIITFDNSSEKHEIEADIFISVDRVSDNAEHHEIAFLDELSRVMIHGVLHLTGHDDKTDEDKTRMRKLENAYLSLRQN